MIHDDDLRMTPPNPYHADAPDAAPLADAPFAGRREAFARVYGLLSAATQPGALAILGDRRAGRTAILHALANGFRESAIPVILPMRAIAPDEWRAWPLRLAQETTAAALASGVASIRFDDLAPPGDDALAWFAETFAPVLLAGVTAPRKRLLLLFDDADAWIDAAQSGALPPDTFARWRSILEVQPEIVCVMTLDDESRLGALDGLSAGDALRLHALAADEIAWLIRQPVAHAYTVSDDAIALIARATGGAPAPAQAFGYHLYTRWALTPELTTLTADDVRAVTPIVAAEGAADTRAGWDRLSRGERWVLSAISRIGYADPLAAPDADAIAQWLAESGVVLDATAIRAAIRRLEYRAWLTQTPDGVRLGSGLLQLWLLENAGDVRRPSASVGGATPDARRADANAPPGVSLRMTLALIAVTIVLAVIAAFALNAARPPIPAPLPVTATLNRE